MSGIHVSFYFFDDRLQQDVVNCPSCFSIHKKYIIVVPRSRKIF